MFALIGKDFSMSSGKKFIVLVLSALVLALAWMGGTWTTTQGATQGQSTLPTITPTREPPDTPTPHASRSPTPIIPHSSHLHCFGGSGGKCHHPDCELPPKYRF